MNRDVIIFLEYGFFAIALIGAYVLLLFFYSSVLVRTYVFLGILPLICVFFSLRVAGIEASPEKTYFLALLPMLIYKVFFKTDRTDIWYIPKNISKAFGLFVVVMVVAQTVNEGMKIPPSTAVYLAGLLGKGLIVYFVVRIVDNERKLEFCLKNVVVSLFIIQALSWCEICFARDFYFFRMEYLRFIIPLSEFTPLGNPNLLARYIIILYPFSALGLYYFKKNSLSYKIALANIVGVALLIVATLSRAGMIAFIIQAGMILYYNRKSLSERSRSFIPVALAVTVFFFVVFGGVMIERFTKMYTDLYSPVAAMSDRSFMEINLRMRTWLASIRIIGDYPLTGVALSNLEETMINYGSVKIVGYFEGTEVITIHGSILRFLVLGGVFAGIAFVSLAFKYLKLLYQKYKSEGRSRPDVLMAYAFISAAGVFLASLAADPLYLNIFWFTAGMALAANIIGRQEEKNEDM